MSDQLRLDSSKLRRVGMLLVLVGCIYVVATQIEISWLPFVAPLLFFVIQTGLAFAEKNSLDFLFCNFGLSACIGCVIFFSPIISIPVIARIGAVILVFGISFLLVDVFQFYKNRKAGWWAFFVGLTICFTGIPFLKLELSVMSLALWISLGVGGGMALWGLAKRLLGLIIAGSLVSSMGFGVYAAWNQMVSSNGLTETGIMLVWFGLGWGSITILTRLRMTRTLGWPLIPAGILGVVGWGLYSGGDPNNALSFIGNTGSLGVLIFGLYFLLMRRGIRR